MNSVFVFIWSGTSNVTQEGEIQWKTARGYHVLDEAAHLTSDVCHTAKQLWKPLLSVLEVDILGAKNLEPMKSKDGQGATDAYCVAKYRQKWVRSRTIVNSFSLKWNEQYTWEVYDPCTILTLGVFDNCHLNPQSQDDKEKAPSPQRCIGKGVMGWAHPDIGLDEMLFCVKAFVEILNLTFGY
eukprot:Gb_20202 [translate_table: standard]